MQDKITLINLLSDQVYANLIAILSVKPQRVVWIHTNTPKFLQMLDYIRSFCSDYNSELQVEVYSTNPYEPEATEGICKRVMDTGINIINVTGGTKIMAFGAMAASQKNSTALIYIDTINQRIIHPLTGVCSEVPYTAPNLKQFLEIQGWNVVSKVLPDEHDNKLWRALWSFYKERAAKYPQISWQKITEYLKRSEVLANNIFRFRYGALEQKQPDFEHFLALLKMLNLNQIASVRHNDNDITVKVEDSQTLQSIKQAGNLLERRVLLSLSEYRDKFEGIYGSAKLQKADAKTQKHIEQEIDALVAHKGRLGIISCKSSLPPTNNRQIYLQEIRTVGDILGGKMAVLLLITLDILDPRKDSLFLQKAKSMGVIILDRNEVVQKNFGAKLLELIMNRQTG